MPTPPEWSLTAPQKLTFEEPVTALNVRLVKGTLNIVGTDSGPARLELTAVSGPPLRVTLESGLLTVGYEDLPWRGLLSWLDRPGRRRSVTVTLTVPTATRVEAGVVAASAVVSGVTGATDVRGVTGDVTLVGLGGPVRAESVAGALEAQSLAGDLRFNSVSGDLTLVEGRGGAVRAETVNGSMVIDLAEGTRPALDLTTVSGDVALRLPEATDADVEATTATGPVSCAFAPLSVNSPWGPKRLSGRLGAGGGRIKISTISGALALLRRPEAAEAPEGKVL
ncbi:DUF4097 family beta strand repeat-containing protein [Streptomyces caatingaensis]|uniref:DUF4097 domain-containing protein n=1 Tax=Streptomyces caatingaensis TaxID=1678637 RepID=A0A0K9XFB7_9ACTN|nr:DUF4097 family beta strand repeat-containing protein [Streptomyces caatingaensis]KNB51928.1 hypothetical protein AC230_16680 [Streptomyces caatingaensis]